MEHLLEPQPGYPFAVSIRIEYTLSRAGLRVCTTATNVGADPCPYGAGAHPYLTVGGATVDSAILHVPARSVLRSDERGLPAGSLSVDQTDYDFTRPRRIGRTRLDHAFTDLERDADGLARVELQAFRGQPGANALGRRGLRVPHGLHGHPLPDVNRRSIAIEPMTCPPNAFRTGDRVIRLEPAIVPERLGHHSAVAGAAPRRAGDDAAVVELEDLVHALETLGAVGDERRVFSPSTSRTSSMSA